MQAYWYDSAAEIKNYKKLSIALFDPGRWVETWRKRHSSDHGQPDRLHPSGGRLQAEQAD